MGKCHLLHGPAPQSGGRGLRVSRVTSEDAALLKKKRVSHGDLSPPFSLQPHSHSSDTLSLGCEVFHRVYHLKWKQIKQEMLPAPAQPPQPDWGNFVCSFQDTGGQISPQKCVFWIISIITVSNTGAPAWCLDFITFLWKWPITLTSQVHRRPKAVLQARTLRFCC